MPTGATDAPRPAGHAQSDGVRGGRHRQRRPHRGCAGSGRCAFIRRSCGRASRTHRRQTAQAPRATRGPGALSPTGVCKQGVMGSSPLGSTGEFGPDTCFVGAELPLVFGVSNPRTGSGPTRQVARGTSGSCCGASPWLHRRSEALSARPEGASFTPARHATEEPTPEDPPTHPLTTQGGRRDAGVGPPPRTARTAGVGTAAPVARGGRLRAWRSLRSGGAACGASSFAAAPNEDAPNQCDLIATSTYLGWTPDSYRREILQ